MPFVSSSWADASFLNVEVIDPIDADPFLEKRHGYYYHHSSTTTAAAAAAAPAASKLDPEIVLKMRPERMEEEEDDDDDDDDDDDGMLNDCEESDIDVDQDLEGDLKGADIHNADREEDKDSGYLSDIAGAGADAEARGAHKRGTIGTAYQYHRVFGEGRNDVSGDEEEEKEEEEEERLGIEKLTQGILALQLDTINNNNNNNNNNCCSHRADVSRTKLKFPNLEYGYQGPPPSPSWPPSSPLCRRRSETESVSSSCTTTTTPVLEQNNGVTVRGSYVVIKMPKNREPVVTMPKGFSSVAVILPSITTTAAAAGESDDIEEKEVRKKRSSGNLKNVEETDVSPKKRR
ncbi:hypothetical protein BGZ97_009041 [Linnemannia gamsii]|uniref:Uncharacterized protein n=1 Tax=Linnemannia gamsii TaxID=64522 RepID=A0A9P6QQK3_9FUNG|nr:hypothetical protein BGZ97_009041 [Linnemannia gamsii]